METIPIIEDTTGWCGEISLCLPKTRDGFGYIFNSIFSHNIQIFTIKDNKLIRLKISYIFCKIPLIRRFFNKKGDFFCIVNNKFGLHKTIFKNTDILEIIKVQKSLNILNKTDNLFDNKILESIKLIHDDNTKFDFTKKIVNIDKSLNMTLKDFFYYHNIFYNTDDKIYIKFTDYTTFNEIETIEGLNKYYHKNINELITS
jgi:hypothetical protein